MISIADGSDTGGSLRNPASFCNVVGPRPSPGRVPEPDPAPWLAARDQGPDGAHRRRHRAGSSRCSPARPRGSPAALDRDGSELAAPPTALRGVRVAWAPDLGGRVPSSPPCRGARTGGGLFAGLGATVELGCPGLTAPTRSSTCSAPGSSRRPTGDCPERDRDVKKPVRWNIERGLALSRRGHRSGGGVATRPPARVHEFFDRYDVLLAPVTQVLPFDAAGVPDRGGRRPDRPDYLGWMGPAR